MLNTKQAKAKISPMEAALRAGYVEMKGTQFTTTKKGLRAVRAWKHQRPALSFAFIVRVKEIMSEIENKEQGDETDTKAS